MNMISAFFREHSGKTCPRRILGTFGFLVCCAAVLLRIDHPLLDHLLGASAALIGSTVFDVFSTPAGHKRSGGDGNGNV